MKEITAYRYGQRSDGSVKMDEGKVDVPDECAEKLKRLLAFDVILTLELLRTDEVAYYLEHRPTQYSLSLVIEPNVPLSEQGHQERHLKNMQKLFDGIDEVTLAKRISEEAFAVNFGSE